MTLRAQLTELVSACFTGIWVLSDEHQDALTEIAQACREKDWRLAVWDASSGLRLAGQAAAESEATGGDPLAAIRALDGLSAADSSALLVLVNFHCFLASPEMVQAVAERIFLGKQRRTFLIVLAPVVQYPGRIAESLYGGRA